MTESTEKKKGKGKTASLKRGAREPKDPLAYAAMHETNLALCFASGFLTPRHEKSAARDHHWRSGGKLILSGKPVSPELVAAARGGLNYGNVVLAEISTARLDTENSSDLGQVELRGPLPLANLRRALFRSPAERDEFVAKIAGYADVPGGVIELAVDADAFPKSEPALELFATESVDVGPYAVSRTYDVLGGAVVALLHHLRTLGEVVPLELLRDVLSIAPGETAQVDIAGGLAGALDSEGGSQGALVARLVMELLIARPSGTGFNPAAFLDQLHEAVARLPANAGAPIDKFVDHAKDILSARKDIRDDAHADAAGKVVSRALLLFLLNPDPEKLYSLRKRPNKLGKSVYSLALFFSGGYKGLAGLPGLWKSFDTQAFLAIGVFAAKLFYGLAVPLNIVRSWNQVGSCVETLTCEGYALARRAIPVDLAIEALVKHAQMLEWVVSFDPDNGALSLAIPKGSASRRASARMVAMPTFPREPSIEIATVCDKVFSRKDVVRIVNETNAVAASKALFARATPRGKSLVVEYYAFIPCRAISQDSLKGAVGAIFDNEGGIRPLSGDYKAI